MRLLAPEEDLGTIDARVGPACPEALVSRIKLRILGTQCQNIRSGRVSDV